MSNDEVASRDHTCVAGAGAECSTELTKVGLWSWASSGTCTCDERGELLRCGVTRLARYREPCYDRHAETSNVEGAQT